MAPEYLGNTPGRPGAGPGAAGRGLAGVATVTMVGLLVGPVRRCCASAAPRGRAPAAALAGPGRGLRIGAAGGRPGRPVPGQGRRGAGVLSICLALLPLATGAAILRYRLYDLDRIISRTVAYGLLTVVLGLGYGAQCWWRASSSGHRGPAAELGVAGATLALAAMFRPARRRVQQVVDRRFNRRRYDAARTLDAFAVRLRDEVDLDALNAELLAVVAQTMQPTRASLATTTGAFGGTPTAGPTAGPGGA